MNIIDCGRIRTWAYPCFKMWDLPPQFVDLHPIYRTLVYI